MKKTEYNELLEIKQKEREKIAKELLNLDIDKNLKTLLKEKFPNIEN